VVRDMQMLNKAGYFLGEYMLNLVGSFVKRTKVIRMALDYQTCACIIVVQQ